MVKFPGARLGFALLLLATAVPAAAQAPQSAGPPRLVAFNGAVAGADGQPRTGTTTLTFSLYQDQDGNTPIWQEVQTVQLNEKGQYYVWLGQQAALPVDVFQNSQAQWLGVTPQGLQEQPRVKLLSVPYALKAGDAETLGGLPASAFLRALNGNGGGQGAGGLNDAQGQARKPQAALVSVLDNVIADDQIVQGRECVGSTQCVNGEGFDAFFKVKTLADPSVKLEQVGTGGIPAQNWFIVGDEFGLAFNNSGSLGTGPFVIKPAAPSGSLLITATGQVSIGNGSPVQKFEVQGTGSTFAQVKGTSGGNAGLHLVSGATCPVGQPLCNDIVVKNNAADNSFTIDNPNGAEHFRIMGDGRTAINTPAPIHAFTATFAASSYMNLISLGGNAGQIFTAGSKEAVTRLNIADGSFVWENPNGTERMRITQSGLVGIGTTNPTQPLMMGSGAYVSAGGVWTDASSRTLKEKIASLSLPAAKKAFARLQPVTFVYKASPTEKHVGFIAEDVPDLVARADRKSVAPMDILAVMTKVVQDQQKTIDDLKARLAKLEALMADAPVKK